MIPKKCQDPQVENCGSRRKGTMSLQQVRHAAFFLDLDVFKMLTFRIWIKSCAQVSRCEIFFFSFLLVATICL